MSTSFQEDMFHPPSSGVYSMDDVSKYGRPVYYLPYRKAVELNLVKDTRVIVLEASPDILASLSDDRLVLLQTADGTEIDLNTEGQKAFAAALIAARKCYADLVKDGSASKALAFMNRKAYCDNAIDPMHPFSLLPTDGSVPGFTFHSGMGEHAKTLAKETFAKAKGPALMASVRSIREGVSINSADTGIFLRGYGADDDGTSSELTQHHGRLIRKSDRPFCTVIIPIPPIGSYEEARTRTLRIFRDLMEQLGLLPEITRILEGGGRLTPGNLKGLNVEIRGVTTLSAQEIADSIEAEVIQYVRETNRPLALKLDENEMLKYITDL
jgi:hypothetical protein